MNCFELDCFYYDNASSMAYVLEHAIRSAPALLMQGNMYENNLLFQLRWTPRTLEILQVGVEEPLRKQKLATKWFTEVMDVCAFHGIRVITRNVKNTSLVKKLQKRGFLALGNNDYVFPF
jgi:hypothetical protein